jgi:hypothetical protein
MPTMQSIGRVREHVQRVSASDTGRLIVRTLYYLAIIVGLAFTHLDPDHRQVSFVYQAF